MKKQLAIRKGFCLCGCGKKLTSSERYIHGHNGKGKNNSRWRGGHYTTVSGYEMTRSTNHPRSGVKGYVYDHILVAESVLGKFLPKKAQVHHVNENPSDNRKENLVICEDDAYHKLLHQRARAFKAGGIDLRRCSFCKTHDKVENLISFSCEKDRFMHRNCYNAYQRKTNKKRRYRTLGDVMAEELKPKGQLL